MTALTGSLMIGFSAIAFLIESAIKVAAVRMTKRRLTAARLSSLSVQLSKYER